MSEAVNINAVYGDLVKAIYERGWADHVHPAVRSVSEESFVRLLEEVAIAVWHGAGRTTTLREVEEHCKESRVISLLPALEQGTSSGVSALLLAFYFRQKGHRSDGDKTFEFTHKTFGEYLTALRLVRLVRQVAEKLREAEVDPDSGWSDEEALYRWLLISGPTAVDVDLLEFISREMVIQRHRASDYQRGLERVYNAFLRISWPMNRFSSVSFLRQQTLARNAEEALFACVNSVARVTRVPTRFDWPTETSFGDALKRMQGQRPGPGNRIIQSCLSYLDVPTCCLDMADLYSADLSFSNLRRARLHFVNLQYSDLTGADLSGSLLIWANLENAVIMGTNFEEADMGSVNFGSEHPYVPTGDPEKQATIAGAKLLAEHGARGHPRRFSILTEQEARPDAKIRAGTVKPARTGRLRETHRRPI